jgi:methyl-accepting chemotaxis protein
MAAEELEQIESMTSRQADANEQLSSIISQIKESTHETSASSEQIHNALRTLKELVTQLQAQASDQDDDGATLSASVNAEIDE